VAALTLRLHAARVVAWREVRLAVVGLGGYVAVSLALLAAGWIISNDVRAVRAADVLVLEHPFRTPVTVAVLLVSMFLGVSAVVSVARERDRGTLEVLFYGPIDEASYLAGKLFGQLGGYAAALPVLLIGLSRINLRAHWPSDVAGAYLLSGLWLGLSLEMYRRWKQRATIKRAAHTLAPEATDAPDRGND
jgi:membrane-associated phospholipid phosphatase